MENLLVCDLGQTRCVALVCNLINVLSDEKLVCALNDRVGKRWKTCWYVILIKRVVLHWYVT